VHRIAAWAIRGRRGFSTERSRCCTASACGRSCASDSGVSARRDTKGSARTRQVL